MGMEKIPTRCLGQAGFLLTLGSERVCIDPYLSHSVEKAEGPQAKRLYPIVVQPQELSDLNFVLISHLHLDHCDPETLLPMSESSPQCLFLGPYEVINQLRDWGIESDRLQIASETGQQIGSLKVYAVPAAHPTIERDAHGNSRFIGFVLEYKGRRIYHSGDTKPHADILQSLRKIGPIDTAFLPVNEKNFFRDKMNIVGNMSIREAFGIAEDLGIKTVVPMHWDMFLLNLAYREEIEVVYEKARPDFEIKFYPDWI